MLRARAAFSRAAAGALCLLLIAVSPAAAAQEGEPEILRKQPAAADPAAKPTGTKATGDATDDLPWLDALAAGYTEASRRRGPILVNAGGADCPHCARLAEEISRPLAQQELARWVLVRVDVDKSPDDARLLGVGPIPALRLLTPSGKLVAAREGALSAEELVAWLKEHREAAAAAPPAELTAGGAPNVVAAVRLVREFEQRDAVLREAAIRRLLPHPDVAAFPVASAFAEGPLATRLAALELLAEWKAPVDGLDPWQPETITAERLAALDEWALAPERRTVPAAEGAAAELSAEQLQSAREMVDRMLAADAVEAAAIRERLVRLGPKLLPEVYARLQQVERDQDRERLWALRYRLVATPRLALDWPGGIERLASIDVRTRQTAADELSRRATAEDEALLLEMFGDPAPLVREISLRALRATGGAGVAAALVRLLDDPDPNVRAAVLKQLAEKPTAGIAEAVAEYVGREPDADLVVHAARLLGEAPGTKSAEALRGLLAHESWRVRAQAAEALGKALSGSRYSESKLSAEESVEGYAALVELLDDEDGFVVSRAVQGLADSNLAAAVEPMVQVAEKHPALAANVIEVVARGAAQRPLAIPHLRRFCGHASPAVRAAAIAGLCSIEGIDAEAELRAALADAESDVRIASAGALYQMLETRRYRMQVDSDPLEAEMEPEEPRSALGAFLGRLFGGMKKEPPAAPPAVAEAPAGDPPAEQPADAGSDEPTTEAERLRFAAQLPRWQRDLEGPLVKLVEAERLEERLAGALPLAALGAHERALPVLLADGAASERNLLTAAGALPWLPRESRGKLFDALLAAAKTSDGTRVVIHGLSESKDPQTADRLWRILREESVDSAMAAVVADSLKRAYFGDRSYSPESAPLSRRKKASEALVPKAETGTRWERLVAFSILGQFDPDRTAELARKIVDDPAADEKLRGQAFRLVLSNLPEKEAARTAVATLEAQTAGLVEPAVQFLAGGAEALAAAEGDGDDLVSSAALARSARSRSFSGSGQPIVPAAPEGLQPEALRPLLEGDDPRLAAYAAYLLAVTGDEEGLERLIGYWSKRPEDPQWSRLVYRAIAALDDSTRLPVLEQIYARFPKEDQFGSGVGDFYWTIRIMTGPEVLEFRKRIRDEVGVDRLR
ncbi:MAG: HEAT repeat domain-containing protein [Planctomycetales bacterium]